MLRKNYRIKIGKYHTRDITQMQSNYHTSVLRQLKRFGGHFSLIEFWVPPPKFAGNMFCHAQVTCTFMMVSRQTQIKKLHNRK